MAAAPQDFLAEAVASLELYYEYNQPTDPADYPPSQRLLESVAESLVSIAESLNHLAKYGMPGQ